MKYINLIFQRRFLFHLLVWFMYALFMLIDMGGYVQKRGWLFMLTPFAVSLSLMAILVYGNTLVLIPRLLEKKRIFWYLLGALFLVGFNTLLRSKSQQYFDAIVWPTELMSIDNYFKWNLFYAIWFIIISSLLFYTQRWAEQRDKVKNIEINQLQTELKYLRAQVNPHFLFNGLNTIYGTIDIENKQARKMMVQFSDLLRYNLYEADVDWMPLEKETVYLENYVALQRARSDTNLKIDLEISIVDGSVMVAPLIFVAFVENAFKYSTRDDKQANSVFVRLVQHAGQLLFECRNSYTANKQRREGIGLANVTRRLELLYPDRYSLDIQKEYGFFTVHLTLAT